MSIRSLRPFPILFLTTLLVLLSPSLGAALPEVQGFLPTEGPPGTLVNLHGTGFTGVQGVSFGATPAARVVFKNDGWVQAWVPATEGVSRLALATAEGSGRSGGEFRALPPRAGRPKILGLTPDHGLGNETIRITGTHLATVERAFLGPTELGCSVQNDHEVLVYFTPEDAVASGRVTLHAPQGEAMTPLPFTVFPQTPVVNLLAPRRGAPGSLLAVRGTHLNQVVEVAFGSARTTDLRSRSATGFTVPVPARARAGLCPIHLRTKDGRSLRVPGAFSVGLDAPLAYGLEKAYLTQGIQDGTVPLVAGRPAVFRAFALANQPNTLMPAVRVNLRNAKGAELTALLTGPETGVPENLDEAALGTYNLRVPGDFILPGRFTFEAELLPDEAHPGVRPLIARYPHTGEPEALEVLAVPPLAITLRPIRCRQADGGPYVTGRVEDTPEGKARWKSRILQLFPVPDVDVTVGPVFDAVTVHRDNTALTLGLLVLELEEAHAADTVAPWRNWHGVFSRPHGEGYTGMAELYARPQDPTGGTSVGFDDASHPACGFPEILAHEVAHTKGRAHAPCGEALKPDPRFPNPPAGLGGAAFDVAGMKALEPSSLFDLMGYCLPYWISAYTYKGILDFLREVRPPAAPPEPKDCLSVTGTIHDGAVNLEPALEFRARPRAAAPGASTLSCLDAHGRTLLEVPFEPKATEDPELATFALLIPMTPALKEGLAELRVSSPRARGAVRLESPAAPHAREPAAVRLAEGEVRVGWDAGAFPHVMIREGGTGEVLANTEAADGEAQVSTGAKELELLMSDGVRTTTRKIPVTE